MARAASDDGGGGTVYVLGAGASHEGGVPLARQILPVGWELLGALRARGRARRRAGRRRDYLDALDAGHAAAFASVYRFIARVFQGRRALDLASMPLLDELWALLEIAYEARATFGRGALSGEVPRVRDALMSLMYHVLVGARVRYDARARPRAYRVGFAPGPNPYTRFVARLGPRDAVVALNYDTLLDRAVARAGRAIDYGTDVLAAGRRPRARPITVLKLHGSFNWLYCPSCQTLEDHGGANVAHLPLERRGRAVYCPIDGARREYVIVPPSLIKSYDNLHLRRIWTAAAARLRSCSRLVFVGYAMSDSDVAVRYLVKQASSLNATLAAKSGGPRVTAVDMSEEGLASYERLFGRGRVERLRVPFGAFVDTMARG